MTSGGLSDPIARSPAGAFAQATFGRTGPLVTRLGFGAMGLGGHFGRQDASAGVGVVLEALQCGINFIDTARAYGQSESVIGQALRQWRGPRPFVATKLLPASPAPGAPPGAGWQHPVALAEAYPAGSIRESLARSLQELGLPRVDLLQLHYYWPHWDDEIWLNDIAALRREGLVGAIGISVPDHRHDVALSLVRSGLIDAVQTIVNIFDPLALDTLAPLCARHGVALIARCCLDEGGLTGAITADTSFPPDAWLHGYFDCLPRGVYLERVERLRRFVPAVAGSLAELALRYVLSFPAVSVALTSMHVRDHLQANLRALAAGPLPPAVVEELRHRDRWIRNFYQARRHAPAC